MAETFADLSLLSGRAVGAGVHGTPTVTVVPRPKSRWKTRVLVPGGMLLAAVGLFAYAARDALRPATPVRVVPVVVRTVAATQAAGGDGGAASTGGVTVQAPGWVEPDPYPVAVTALADGVVKEVLILEGQAVKAGQVVARLIEQDAELALHRAEADVAAREAELHSARAALRAAMKEWENPVERERAVKAAEAMVAQMQGELERLPVEVAAEKARAEELADAAKRAEANYASRAIGESELVRARLQLKAQEALVKATEAKRPVMEAKVRQQEAELAAARKGAELRIAERRMLEEAEAAAAKAEAALRESATMCREAGLRLERMEVKSPADGVVQARLAEPGAVMMQTSNDPRGAQVARLYDPKRLQVRADIPIADAANVGVGQAAKIVVGVLPDRTFDGVVTRVVHEADVARNTLQVKVAIKDPTPELKPEMLARVRFMAGSRGAGGAAGGTVGRNGVGEVQSQQVFAPRGLLRSNGEGKATAWVVDKGAGVARRRDVELGSGEFEGWVAVATGLRAGDALISGDVSKLSEGTRVQVIGEDEVAMKGGHGGAH